MATLQQILNDTGDLWVRRIKLSLRKNKRVTTGKTTRSLRYEVKGVKLNIYGAKHIDNIIGGRGASKSTSGGGWFKELREWAIIKGLTLGQTWGIYKRINKEGWKTPPSPDLLTDAVGEKQINDLKRELAKNTLSLVKAQINKATK
jgi:hypothetical protein